MRLHRRQWLGLALTGCVGWAQAGSFDDFFVAIQRDDAQTITALLRRGFDPDTRDAKGQPGLILALQLGSLQAFAALMAAPKIRVEARNAQDESPLMMAALKGHLEAARALIARDADVNKTGWAPLHYAAAANLPEQPAIIQLLLDNHAYIDAASPNGTTPLMMAAQYGTEASVALLLQSGADPLLKNQLKLTAADFALRVGRKNVVEMIAAAVRRSQPRPGAW